MANRRASYAGVTVSISASISVDGKIVHLGTWPSKREAAIAYDRAVLHFGLARKLNFPADSRKRGPASPDELQSQGLGGSRYRERGLAGVRPRGGRFLALAKIGGRQVYGGSWPTAREAAVARDRLVLHHGLDVELNHPQLSRRLGPASADDLHRVLQAERSPKSRFRGVAPSERSGGRCVWVASLYAAGDCWSLGTWPTEREAAIAVDRFALFHEQDVSRLNCPRTSPTLGPATDEELKRLARARREPRLRR